MGEGGEDREKLARLKYHRRSHSAIVFFKYAMAVQYIVLPAYARGWPSRKYSHLHIFITSICALQQAVKATLCVAWGLVQPLVGDHWLWFLFQTSPISHLRAMSKWEWKALYVNIDGHQGLGNGAFRGCGRQWSDCVVMDSYGLESLRAKCTAPTPTLKPVDNLPFVTTAIGHGGKHYLVPEEPKGDAKVKLDILTQTCPKAPLSS